MGVGTLPISELKGFILANPADANLKMVAEQAAFSPFHVHRKFVQEFGVTPKKVQISRRLQLAQELPRKSDLSVSEICTEVGYASLGTFSSKFYKSVGMTPSAYRVSSRKPIPACILNAFSYQQD